MRVVADRMGDLIPLAAHPRFRSVAVADAHDEPVVVSDPAVFAFDLASPFTYLAAERVERQLSGVVWRPVLTSVAPFPDLPPALAEERAAALGLPLVWPEGPGASSAAMRVASLAADEGCAPAFVVAAGRLAFCGGFELDDPEVIAEAAAIAGLGLEEALAAASDTSRDAPMRDAALSLVSAGADRFPVLLVGDALYAGEDRIEAAAGRAGAGEPRSPLRYGAP